MTKTKQKILGLALSASMIASFFTGMSVTASADGDTSTYSITIPSALTVTDKGWNSIGNLSASGTLEDGKKLNITATSENSWNLTSGEATVAYKLCGETEKEKTYADAAATTALDISKESLEQTGGFSVPIGIVEEDYSTKPVGTYQDTVTFTAKVEIAVPAGITLTRNMTAGGNPFKWGSSKDTLPTAFVAGKQVAVIYKNTSGQTAKVVSDALTASDISNEGKSATINVTVDDADKTQHVTYIYPATMANDDGTLNTGALDAQNGTLDEDIINCCTTTGAWDGNSLPSLELTSPFAIFKFTTKNSDGSATINVTSLTVTIGAQDYVITPASATSTLYVALPAVSDQAVRFSATDSDGKTYTCSQASVTFAAGKYYQSIMLEMAPPITVTWNNDDITGSGNSFTKGGVTITAGSIDFDEKNFEENGTFTTTLGNFTKIEVVVTNGFCDVSNTEGWSGNSDKRTWTGNASSVSFIGDIYGDGNGIKFVFTIEP